MASAQPTPRELDQFYTRPEIAARLVGRLMALLGDRGDVTWLEPSAGGGAFLDRLPQPRIGLDIAPPSGRPDIVRENFLHWSPDPGIGSVVAVGNPPFGRNSSLALRFLNRAAGFCDTVAFVLPRTFEKASLQRRIDPHLHLRHQEVLPPNAFLLEGAVRDVPTVFQVWQREAALRESLDAPLEHPDFRFVRDPGQADFALQRVGVHAGRVSREGLGRSPQSHYFIAVSHPARDVRGVLESIDWSGPARRTAGTPSLARSELVAAYTERAGAA